MRTRLCYAWFGDGDEDITLPNDLAETGVAKRPDGRPPEKNRKGCPGGPEDSSLLVTSTES